MTRFGRQILFRFGRITRRDFLCRQFNYPASSTTQPVQPVQSRVQSRVRDSVQTLSQTKTGQGLEKTETGARKAYLGHLPLLN